MSAALVHKAVPNKSICVFWHRPYLHIHNPRFAQLVDQPRHVFAHMQPFSKSDPISPAETNLSQLVQVQIRKDAFYWLEPLNHLSSATNAPRTTNIFCCSLISPNTILTKL